MLLKAGADPNIVGGYRGSALHAAVDSGYTEVVAMLLASGADPNIYSIIHGTPLSAVHPRGCQDAYQSHGVGGAVL